MQRIGAIGFLFGANMLWSFDKPGWYCIVATIAQWIAIEALMMINDNPPDKNE